MTGVRGLALPASVRWRLTLLYGGLFVVAGALLLALTYALFERGSDGIGRKVSAPPVDQGAPALRGYVESSLEVQRGDQLHTLLVESGVALALMTVASLALGWIVAGRVLAPLRTMTDAARRISADDLHERLATDRPRDELHDLAAQFNGLLARLEGAFAAQRRFVANASHELRTPLTLQQAVVDVALDDPDASADTLRAACLRVRAAGQEQERLIEALLMLARGQQGLESKEPVDLADVVRAVLPPSDGAGPAVRAELGAAPLLGDRRLIERLVVNLVDNAVRHNHPQGKGSWVSLWTGTAHGLPTLRVTNSGPPVPAEQIAGLFEPFRRLGAQRTRHRDGLGLGLSIVVAVAHAHDGAVRAWPGPDGGLLVEAAFPAAYPP
ncbi:sensor histidine kinase [Streptomyces sp. NPDC050400]|uniref:sensor histidine kinase n=1 Tax=Streptomyces sp. NPDC050400 TaxID=3365610 RepID=UPI0037929317